MSNETQHIKVIKGTLEINRKKWWVGMMISLILLISGSFSLPFIFREGLGALPLNQGIFWGVLITNFVFWIGIGHAGTFISAILLLLRQNWRRGINRFAEAMTIIAIILAGLMPIIHLGKPDLFLSMLPLNNPSGFHLLNFNSPLIWDFYAIATYGLISFIFFYLGLLPDLARLRDRHVKAGKWISFISCGWTASNHHWQNLRKSLYILAGIATVLVVSVHSIVSFDFAVSLHIGWHSAVFPLYFVLGALLSGFAMLVVLAKLVQYLYAPLPQIKTSHYENMSKIMIGTSILIAFVYFNELFMSLYSGNQFEIAYLMSRTFEQGAWLYWFSLIASILLPQLFWKKSIRTNPKWVLLIAIGINIGMWIERFMIIVGSSKSSFIQIHQASYHINFTAVGMILFGLGFFFTFFMLFCRFVPVLSLYEMNKEVEL